MISANQTALAYTNDITEPKIIRRGLILGTAAGIDGGNFACCAEATRVLNEYLGHADEPKKINVKTANNPPAGELSWLEQEYRPKYQHELPPGVVGPDLAASTYREIHVDKKLPVPQQQQRRKLAARFAVLFNDAPGMARQPEEECLRIRVSVELERALKPRPPYRNAPRARQTIDETFDENVRLGRMAPAKHSPYSLPVFLLYKYTPEGDALRTVLCHSGQSY